MMPHGFKGEVVNFGCIALFLKSDLNADVAKLVLKLPSKGVMRDRHKLLVVHFPDLNLTPYLIKLSLANPVNYIVGSVSTL